MEHGLMVNLSQVTVVACEHACLQRERYHDLIALRTKVSVLFTQKTLDLQLWTWASHWLQCLGRLSLPPSEGRWMSINLMVGQ